VRVWLLRRSDGRFSGIMGAIHVFMSEEAAATEMELTGRRGSKWRIVRARLEVEDDNEEDGSGQAEAGR